MVVTKVGTVCLSIPLTDSRLNSLRVPFRPFWAPVTAFAEPWGPPAVAAREGERAGADRKYSGIRRERSGRSSVTFKLVRQAGDSAIDM